MHADPHHRLAVVGHQSADDLKAQRDRRRRGVHADHDSVSDRLDELDVTARNAVAYATREVDREIGGVVVAMRLGQRREPRDVREHERANRTHSRTGPATNHCRYPTCCRSMSIGATSMARTRASSARTARPARKTAEALLRFDRRCLSGPAGSCQHGTCAPRSAGLRTRGGGDDARSAVAALGGVFEEGAPQSCST